MFENYEDFEVVYSYKGENYDINGNKL